MFTFYIYNVYKNRATYKMGDHHIEIDHQGCFDTMFVLLEGTFKFWAKWVHHKFQCSEHMWLFISYWWLYYYYLMCMYLHMCMGSTTLQCGFYLYIIFRKRYTLCQTFSMIGKKEQYGTKSFLNHNLHLKVIQHRFHRNI